MNKLYMKKIGKTALNIAKDVVIAGVLSLTSSKLREMSNASYKDTSENIKQAVNLTKNEINGLSPEDWDI